MTEQTKDPGDEAFLKVLRPLVETYHAVMRTDDRHIRTLGLTQAQFDVIATLGDTEGMNCKELSRKTLVTKGTLTGVLDRLLGKGLIERIPSEVDRRSTLIRLTPEGVDCFNSVFPRQVYFLKPFFEKGLSPTEMTTLRSLLLKLKKGFEVT